MFWQNLADLWNQIFVVTFGLKVSRLKKKTKARRVSGSLSRTTAGGRWLHEKCPYFCNLTAYKNERSLDWVNTHFSYFLKWSVRWKKERKVFWDMFALFSSQQARTCLNRSQTSQIRKTLPKATENITFVPVQIIFLTFCQHCRTTRVAIKYFHFEKKSASFEQSRFGVKCAACDFIDFVGEQNWWKDFRIEKNPRVTGI